MQKKHQLHLYQMHQNKDESLLDYLSRFNKQRLQIAKRMDQTYVEAFCNCISPRVYSHKLSIAQPKTSRELFAKVFKWIKGEELERSKSALHRFEAETIAKTNNKCFRSNKR